MPAFSPTYSEAMRDALFREAIDNAVPVREVLRRARAGELEELSPADGATLGGMAYGYALQLVREERQDRGGVSKARSEPAPLAREIASRLLKRALKDAERIARDKPKTTMNTGVARELLKVAEQATVLLKRLDELGRHDAPAGAASKRAPAKPRGLAAQLAAGDDTVHADERASEDQDREREAPRANEANGQTDDTGGGAVRLRAALPAPAAQRLEVVV
jgi:ribosomal protein S7